ncbi:glycosyltransferase family 39 protein [Streptomyces sp. NBC_01498]|uniref:ArnT family glycosyltransferase n=1 Tax=Streptomyces sp. NBC_01498 TaxID=2975870 RepID=UPI002E7ADA28|nr:glycosyltransferase family 39 protein [Streptomyces sp. NBC_01498]WTL24116.1 glycosyltransferase family 39 protein [Streptomyces sp. NBC_01498]
MPVEPPSTAPRPAPVRPVPTRRSAAPAAAGPASGYWRRLLPVLALIALTVRLPSFLLPFWSPDEGYLAVQARMLADGGELYETVVDRKTPLLPLLYEAAFTLFGDQSVHAVKLLAVTAQFTTAVLLAAFARHRWGDRSGVTAGVLFLLISVGFVPQDGQAVTFEVVMLPFTAAAVLCADRGRWGAAGVAVAGAFLTKQTGGAVLVPVLWMLWRTSGRAALATRLPCTVIGFAAPVTAAALLTDPAGFVFWTVTGSGSYAFSLGGSELYVLLRAVVNTLLLGLCCAGVLPPVRRALRAGRVTGRPLTDLWIWCGASAGAVAVGFHFYGHYFQQLLPPVALLATAALRSLRRERLRSVLAVPAGVCALFVLWAPFAPRPELAHAARVAAAVRQHSAPADRVLVWGIHPQTYRLADRAPASRYLTAGLLTNFSGGRNGPRVGEAYGVPGAWRVFTAEMRTRPPALIVDDSRGKPYAPEHLPTLRRLLAGSYERLPGTVAGAVFYVRSRGS